MRPAEAALRLCALAALLSLSAGCSSTKLGTAREQFYTGRLDEGATTLTELPKTNTDRVLVLMERGAINQARGRYADSVEDWLRANSLADQLDLVSMSRSSTSILVNDNVLSYCGAPYERTLLHALSAQSYMMLGLWQDAAVEGRRLIRRLENRGDYPDDPYGRYVAGLSLELMGDAGGAAFQYRKASEIAKLCSIEPRTGALGPVLDTNATEQVSAPAAPANRHELVAFVSIGRGPTGYGYASANHRWGDRPYAEFYAGDQLLGRSYTLMRTEILHAETEKVLAVRKAAKTAARIALKETAAHAVSEQNDDLGALVWLILFALERPDTRQWETLPQWLSMARFPCPPGLKEVRVVLKNSAGAQLQERTFSEPLVRRGDRTVLLYRAF